MTCRAPLEAAYDGKNKPIVYKRLQRPKTLAEGYEALELPCGQCRGCRLEHARKWSVRMMHEAAYREEFENQYSVFVTLTYDQKNLPMGETLVKHQLQDFFKRFRSHISPQKISYYAVGEYGSTCPYHEIINCPLCGPLQRPHYHAIIFGWSAPDKVVLGTRDGEFVYESEILYKSWKLGAHEIGSCTFESCSYVARYITKKITGKQAEDHYVKHLPLTDQIVEVDPEFAIMSRNPAIGKRWFEEYWQDVYPEDECPIPGRFNQCKPPRYYDTMYERENPEEYQSVKSKRRDEMALSLLNGPSLESRAKCEDARLERFGGKI